MGYLLQAGKGQLAIMNRARPIREVLEDEKTPPRVRGLLGEIAAIKAFGERNALKATANYTEFVKLDRDAASYVVSACEPLRFKPKEWRFPIVGSLPYLGWFSLERARKHAARLREEGWDVDLRGAGAYSTLGWFRDPVLSSMIGEGEAALGNLVNVVLHESVHATLYVKGQSFFNESLANFAGDRLTLDYLDGTRGREAKEAIAYRQAEADWEKRRRRMHEAYEELNRVYESARPEAEKRAEKERVLQALKTEFGAKREITNATLMQFKTYETGTPEFEELFRACGSSWTSFFGSLRALKPESFPSEQLEQLGEVLRPLIRKGCPRDERS
ncbi:MAG: aminopeptidase [Oligoflexia bacterium]|nr:aminopeptidase [Oligoflexia bacterium]